MENSEELIRKVETEDAQTLFELGVAYFNGDGVEQDYQKATDYYEKAANAGHPDAQLNLGIAYMNGQGVQKSISTAFEWVEKAANQGNPNALFNFGLFYFNGWGTEADLDTAWNYICQAARCGHERAIQVIAQHHPRGFEILMQIQEELGASMDEEAF